MAAKSGAFMKAHRYREPIYERPQTVDPAHMVPGSHDQAVVTWEATPYQAVGPGPAEFERTLMRAMPGVELDRNSQDHSYGGTHTATAGPAENGAVRSQDDGTDLARGYDEPTMSFNDERYVTQVVQGYAGGGGLVDNPAAQIGVRGLNSNPANNPPQEAYGGAGWREGTYRLNWPERNYAPPPRYHEYRVVTPYTAQLATEGLPPENPLPYGGTFPTLARAIRNITRKPGMRRIPSGLSEYITTDGADEPSPVPTVADSLLLVAG